MIALPELTQDIGSKLDEAKAFLAGFRSVQIASTDLDGVPDASYAPFVRCADNCFYLYVSALSTHTGNLRRSHRASLLLVQDESESRQIFARRRMTFQCEAVMVSRESLLHAKIMGMMREKFGEVMQMIEPLPDFRTFRLRPIKGSYVTGFAGRIISTARRSLHWRR